MKIYFFLWFWVPTRAMASPFLRFHTQRHTTVGRTPLGEWSARPRDLYLTTHNTTDKHPCLRRIRTYSLRKREATDLRLRPRGHWHQHNGSIEMYNSHCVQDYIEIIRQEKRKYAILPEAMWQTCIVQLFLCSLSFVLLLFWKKCLQPVAMNETIWNDVLFSPASDLKVTVPYTLPHK